MKIALPIREILEFILSVIYSESLGGNEIVTVSVEEGGCVTPFCTEGESWHIGLSRAVSNGADHKNEYEQSPFHVQNLYFMPMSGTNEYISPFL